MAILLLVEHQSTPSPAMSSRLLDYMVGPWQRQRREAEQARRPEGLWRLTPLVPLVFYTGSRRWRRPRSLASLLGVPAQLRGFVPSFEVLFFPLLDTPSSALRRGDGAFGHVLRLMQLAKADAGEFESELVGVVHGVEEHTGTDLDAWRGLVYFARLWIAHYRPPEEQERLQELVVAAHRQRRRREEIEAMGRTIAQHLIKEGRALGRKEGRRQGEARGRRFILLNQLQAKFGVLPGDMEERLAQRTPAELDELAVALIRAESLEELGLR